MVKTVTIYAKNYVMRYYHVVINVMDPAQTGMLHKVKQIHSSCTDHIFICTTISFVSRTEVQTSLSSSYIQRLKSSIFVTSIWQQQYLFYFGFVSFIQRKCPASMYLLTIEYLSLNAFIYQHQVRHVYASLYLYLSSSNSCTHCPCGVQCQKKLECGHNCSSNCSKW